MQAAHIPAEGHTRVRCIGASTLRTKRPAGYGVLQNRIALLAWPGNIASGTWRDMRQRNKRTRTGPAVRIGALAQRVRRRARRLYIPPPNSS